MELTTTAQNDTTLLVTTGGTGESFYDKTQPAPENVPLEEPSIIPEVLDRLGFEDQYTHHHVCFKDSKEFTEQDVADIDHTIIDSPESHVLVMHGTDRIAQHAAVIQARIDALPADHPAHQKTIVFMGMMNPLRDEEKHFYPETDEAWQIVHRAMEDVKTQAPGVYIELGRGPWKAEDVEKHVVHKDGKVDSWVLKVRGETVMELGQAQPVNHR